MIVLMSKSIIIYRSVHLILLDNRDCFNKLLLLQHGEYGGFSGPGYVWWHIYGY